MILVELVAVVEQLEEIFVEVGKIVVEVVEKLVEVVGKLVEFVESFGKLVELVVLGQQLLEQLLGLGLVRHEPLVGLLVLALVEVLGACA